MAKAVNMAQAPMRERATWPSGRRVASPCGKSPLHHKNSAKGSRATAERKNTICPSGTEPLRALMQTPIPAKANVEPMRSQMPRVSSAI